MGSEICLVFPVSMADEGEGGWGRAEGRTVLQGLH